MATRRIYTSAYKKLNFSAYGQYFYFQKLRNNFFGAYFYCTTQQTHPNVKYIMKLDPDVEKKLDSEELKHSKNPGIRKQSPYSLPPILKKAVEEVLSYTDKISLLNEVDAFNDQLLSRRLPIEANEIQGRMQSLFPQIYEMEDLSAEEKKLLLNEARNSLKCELRRWKPIDYSDKHEILLYLVSRLAANYASVMKVFSEIQFFLPSFKPKSFFDFGSGIGSATWAAYSTWEENIKEYFCVDVSLEMNELCEKLLQDGDTGEKILKNIFFRQFLPASNKIKYDLVVSAFSLLDIPSQVDRLRTIDTLWRKTTDMMVLIEPGNLAGFSAILDARDYILHLESFSSDSNPKISDPTTGAYVLCPCPHKSICPRTLESKVSPCTSFASYYQLFPKKALKGSAKRTFFSYVVLRRGPKPTDHLSWPRIVKPVIKSSNHLHCHLCCNNGQLKAAIITKQRHGRNIYRCVRKSELGDLLPIIDLHLPQHLDDNVENSNSSND